MLEFCSNYHDKLFQNVKQLNRETINLDEYRVPYNDASGAGILTMAGMKESQK